ncbi:PREDICTED: uncharacterized protein LOC109486939 [Branchiostoma belcheri]|uniref:Uncharacterized protein LOC109486939 n=1 Tax=Branchiostoma belcheri TaxID=7741 RepID=A0A6P5AJH0_BRABE|nr:PREDICTED: uncharacterized protein LOC109486939 [Branchiostoma belcheri]
MLMVLYVQGKEEGKKPMHLLLDEPVALFHGNLVRKLLNYLKKEQFCVVLACHAVDTLMACSRIISLDGDNPRIIPKDVMSALGTLFRGSDHTTRLMEFSKTLKTKCILIVENETDAEVLKAWIKKLRNIDIDDKIVVHCNSTRPTPDVVGKLVGFLDKNLFHQDEKCEKEQEKAKVFILTDRDYKADMALEKEQRILRENTKKYVRIKVEWYCYQKNEQENNFLSATALKSYLEEKGGKTESMEKIEKLDDLLRKHCRAFSIREKYMNSVRNILKEKGGKDKLKDPEFHQVTEDETKEWLAQPSSFTDAKGVLKELGVEEEPQSYIRIIHHFLREEIDSEIKALADKVLKFFNIGQPTGAASAASPSEETGSPQQDDSASSKQGTETAAAEGQGTKSEDPDLD